MALAQSSPASLSVSREAVPLPMLTRSTPCFFAQRCERVQRPVPVIARRMRIDGRRLQDLARAIDDGDLHARAQPRIESHRGPRTRRSGEQQIVQVAREDADGLFLGALAQLREQLALELPGAASPARSSAPSAAARHRAGRPRSAMLEARGDLALARN